jgi:hypothetical protein
MCYVWRKGEVPTGFWWGDLKKRNHLKDPGLYWDDNIKTDLKGKRHGVD